MLKKRLVTIFEDCRRRKFISAIRLWQTRALIALIAVSLLQPISISQSSVK
jgi:hypothetical protein